jgi:hypothetical protein
MNETIKWIIASIALIVGIWGLYQGITMLRSAMLNNVTHPFATIGGGGTSLVGPWFIVAISSTVAGLASKWITAKVSP